MDRGKLKAILSGGPSGSSDEGGQDDPGLQAADAILKAIKAGSAEQLDMALRDHYDACESEHGPPEDSESED